MAAYRAGHDWPTIAAMDEHELALRAGVWMAQLRLARLESAGAEQQAIDQAIDHLRRCEDAAAAAGLEPFARPVASTPAE